MISAKWHIYFWSAYFVAVLIIDSILDPYATFLKELIFFVTQNLFLFYSLLYFLRKFSTRTRLSTAISIGRLVLIMAAFIALRYSVRYYFIATFFDPEYAKMPLRRWFPTCFTWIINMFFYALAYFYLERSFQKQKDLMLAREEKLNEENIALRAQINPHFLYNTLDMLYAKALGKDRELSDGILLLSDVMRYSIRPQDGSKLVNLAEEVEHLQNVIEINSLRFAHSIHIEFSKSGDIGDVKILPLVLITLVENVFKYGELNDPSVPARIQLAVSAQTITFLTFNKKRNGPREISSGIGLQNAVKRLESAYGKKYSLETTDQGDTFQTTLVIHHDNKSLP
jgi:sensor histidine kinase YesM